MALPIDRATGHSRQNPAATDSLAPRRAAGHGHWLVLALLLLVLAGCGSSPTVITWETASEVDTAGFNVYRSPSEQGPWTQINATLIPPSEDPVRGGAYEFTDPGANAGERSFYLLEEVETSGQVNRFPPTEVESSSAAVAWPLWVGLAALAVLVGWLLGGRLRPARRTEAEEA